MAVHGYYGIYEIYYTKAGAVVHEQSEGATKGLRIYELHRYQGTYLCLITYFYTLLLLLFLLDLSFAPSF